MVRGVKIMVSSRLVDARLPIVFKANKTVRTQSIILMTFGGMLDLMYFPLIKMMLMIMRLTTIEMLSKTYI